MPGNHGSTTTRDNFWLIAGGSPLIEQGTSARRVTNANAAATVTHLLGSQAPGGSAGRLGATSLRRRARLRQAEGEDPLAGLGPGAADQRRPGGGDEVGDGGDRAVAPLASPASRTSRLPMMTPSAIAPTSATASGVEIPKPTAAGTSLPARTAATSPRELGRQPAALAGDARERDDVDEAARLGEHLREALGREWSA